MLDGMKHTEVNILKNHPHLPFYQTIFFPLSFITDSFFFNALVPVAFIGVVSFAVIFKFKQIQTGSTGLPPWLDWLFSPISTLPTTTIHQGGASSAAAAAAAGAPISGHSDDDDDDEVSWIDDPIVLPTVNTQETMFDATTTTTTNNTNNANNFFANYPAQNGPSAPVSQMQPPPMQAQSSFFVDFGDDAGTAVPPAIPPASSTPKASATMTSTNTSAAIIQGNDSASHWDKWDDEDSDGWDSLKKD